MCGGDRVLPYSTSSTAVELRQKKIFISRGLFVTERFFPPCSVALSSDRSRVSTGNEGTSSSTSSSGYKRSDSQIQAEQRRSHGGWRAAVAPRAWLYTSASRSQYYAPNGFVRGRGGEASRDPVLNIARLFLF